MQTPVVKCACARGISAVYGSRAYLEAQRQEGGEPNRLGVNCCDFHRSWNRQACRGVPHHFYSDDTQLTQAALREGLSVAYLPCFMGDAVPLLQRHRDPDPANDLGLWTLLHPDLKRTTRVLAFRDHMVGEIEEIQFREQYSLI